MQVQMIPLKTLAIIFPFLHEVIDEFRMRWKGMLLFNTTFIEALSVHELIFSDFSFFDIP